MFYCLGDFGPVLREWVPAADGSAVFVSWSLTGNKHRSTSGGEPLHYVLEWTSVPVAELQWQKVAKDQNNTSITGTGHTHTHTHGKMMTQNLVLHHIKNTKCFNHNMDSTVMKQRSLVVSL